MPRTSEMHCHRRGTGFHAILHLLPPLPRCTNSREAAASFFFLRSLRDSPVFSPSHEGKTRKEREGSIPHRREITDEIERTSISPRALTLSTFLPACRFHAAPLCSTHYDTSDATKTHNCFARRAAINSTFFFSRYREKAPLYVCLTRTERMNNRVVKYFNMTPHGNGENHSPPPPSRSSEIFMSTRLPSGLTIERETCRIVTLILSLSSFHLQDIYLSLSLRRAGDILLSFVLALM